MDYNCETDRRNREEIERLLARLVVEREERMKADAERRTEEQK